MAQWIKFGIYLALIPAYIPLAVAYTILDIDMCAGSNGEQLQ